MKMQLFITFCLLGVLSAQEVIELTSCLTKEKNLRMDCKYTLPDASKTPSCQYDQDDLVMGSTDPETTPESTFKKRVNITLLDDNVCRLILKGFSQDKPQNNSCIITEATSARQTLSVDGTTSPKNSEYGSFDSDKESSSVDIAETLMTCSAISMLFQTSKILLTVTLLPMLLHF